jgi:ribose-phosphate pyrophosphokinase
MAHGELLVFAFESGREFGEAVADQLGLTLSGLEEREFEYGHHKSRPLRSVRGADVFVVQSLHGDPQRSVNDKLCRLLFFLGALRDSGAGRITAVVPYLCYSRKDRKTKSRDPVTTRYVASLFEAVGVDCVVTLEVHNLAAFQNAFRCRTEHLVSDPVFVDHVEALVGLDPAVVVSPDVGGVKRAARFRDALAQRLGCEIEGAFVEKWRSQDVVSGDRLIGDVAGRAVVLFDDMISGGTTTARAAGICVKAGATRVLAAAAHGVFTTDASAVLADAPVERVAVLNHVPPFALDPQVVSSRVTQLDVSPLVAAAIRRMHEDGSLVDLSESEVRQP